ncbi:tyrosine-protein phosphatase [Streptomyces violascens]|uniref:tyrosine-protein phosphatase n=1 Tax=Streptomyces violascens TaxID=67381 RepID=UPI003698F0BB
MRVPTLAPAYVGGVQLIAYASRRLLGERARQDLLRSCSTNVDNLVAGRYGTLATSALLVEEPMELPYALLLLAVLGYAEYAHGAWWAAGVFLLGHVGATLLVYGGLRAGRPSPATRSALDVGTSYGFYATLGALTSALPPGPLLFHCTAGKDRTGWAATVILTLLGADEATVEREYLSVNPAVRQAFAPLIEGFTAQGGDPEIALAIIGVVPEYLAAALEEVATKYGSMEKYVREGLGVPDDAVARLRERLVA